VPDTGFESADPANAYDIYLVFSHDDSKFALKLKTALEKRGLRVRVDLDAGYPEGKQGQGQEIAASGCVGMIISSASVTTGHWKRQLELARRYHKQLIPILYGSLARPDLVPPVLGSIPQIDFSNEDLFESKVEDLLKVIRHESPNAGKPGVGMSKVVVSSIAMPITVMASQAATGASAHITSDKWTRDDALGYEIYAEAIAVFIRNPETKPPLTISIQAAWGGGKTSLMHMVERAIDSTGALRREAELTWNRPPRLNIKDVWKELQRVSRGEPPDSSDMDKERGGSSENPTVWFNAWKYETTNQVWAGLASAIIEQLTARLSALGREKFWLHLNLLRIDPQVVRAKIHDRILNLLWPFMRWFLPTAGAIITACLLMALSGVSLAGSAAGVTTGLSIIAGAIQYARKRCSVGNEPARVSLKEFLDAPNYSGELGFIHHVEEDLRRVFQVVKGDKPVVIFIDDLDRCSPTTVARVMEAVNLFLGASEGAPLPCILILGIDAGMVALALEYAHRDVIERLQLDDTSTPVGWRFMDKFVQLPVYLPCPYQDDIQWYTSSLFVHPELSDQDPAGASRAATSESSLRRAHVGVGVRVVHERMQQQVDDDPEFEKLIKEGRIHFSGNPREIKRFVNLFRFWYAIRRGLEAQKRDVPDLHSLMRWTVFSLKWPQVVRWLRRGGGVVLTADERKEPDNVGWGSPKPRLKALEETAFAAHSITDWQNAARSGLGLDAPDKVPWLNDQDLLRFLRAEQQYNDGGRLSDGCGRGLW